jgi:hypothetical protein
VTTEYSTSCVPQVALVEPTIKRSFWLSLGLAVMVSVAAYFLAFFLFTIHEEIGISAGAALPIAGCTFPIVFLGSLIACLAKRVGGRSR